MEKGYFLGSQAMLFYKGRWHYCNLNHHEIDTLAFLSAERALKMQADLLRGVQVKDLEEWPEALKTDVAEKILSSAEDYRPLLEQNACYLVLGWTTDTLRSIPNDPDKLSAILETLDHLIKKGSNGAYVRFRPRTSQNQ